MPLQPLPEIAELKKTITLPDPWPELEKAGFHEDLVGRAYAHKAWTERAYGKDMGKGKEGTPAQVLNARAFLASIAKGFKSKFDRKMFEKEGIGLSGPLRSRALDAFAELSDEFGDRVSSVMWESLAHLATRENPEVKKSILQEMDSLPHHYAIVDTMLHAFGKVYSFANHVQSVFFRHTGYVLIHNCDCNCSLVNLKKVNGSINILINSEEERFEATQSLSTHMLAESELILNRRLPFEYTITKDAQEVFGIAEASA